MLGAECGMQAIPLVACQQRRLSKWHTDKYLRRHATSGNCTRCSRFESKLQEMCAVPGRTRRACGPAGLGFLVGSVTLFSTGLRNAAQ